MASDQESLKLFLHIHGWYGGGKTYLALTSPGPRLIADVEGRAMKNKSGGEKITWAKWEADGFPRLQGNKTVVLPVREPKHLKDVIQLLVTGKHPFNSFIFDSMTQYQVPLKRLVGSVSSDKGVLTYGDYNPDDVFDKQAWGRLLNHMLMDIEDLLFCTTLGCERPINVILISATDREQAYARPLLEGAIRKRIPGWVDMQGFLKTQPDENGEKRRVLYFEPTDDIDAKCGVDEIAQKWKKGRIVDPNINDIIDVMNEGK